MATIRQREGVGSRRLGRRTMLGGVAVAGGAGFLAACGGSDNKSSPSSGGTTGNIGQSTPVTQGAAASEGPAKPGGIFREATITQAPHFSPFHPGADPSYINFFRRVYGYYDYLWTHKDVNAATRLHLMQAASFEQPDPQTVVVKLKPGKFHNRAPANGRDVTAEDVALTMQFLMKPPSSGGLFMQSGKDLKSVTAIDNQTVKFEMFGPRAFFFEEVQGGIHTGKPTVPKEMLDEKLLKETITVGSGPYEYKSHQQGSTEEVKKNPSYRVAEQPLVAERKLTFVPDTAAQEAAFRSNQIDMIDFSDVKQKDAVVRDLGNKIVVHSRPSTSGMAVIANITRDPWKDIRVREALHRAIDVDRIINTVYFGDAERTWWFSKARFDRTPIGYEGAKQYVAYDPKKAADLIKASGIDTNKEYEFMLPVEAQTWVDAGRLMSEDFAKVGLKVRLTPTVRNIYLQRAGPKPGDFDLSMSVLLDYRHATSNSGSFWNSNALNDPEIDAMVDKIFETVDNQQRQKLSQDFELTLAKKYINFVPVLSTLTHMAWASSLKGFDPEFHPIQGLQAKRWIDK